MANPARIPAKFNANKTAMQHALSVLCERHALMQQQKDNAAVMGYAGSRAKNAGQAA